MSQLQTAGRRRVNGRYSARDDFEEKKAHPTKTVEQRRLRDLLWPTTNVPGQETCAIHNPASNGIYLTKVFDNPQTQIQVRPADPLDATSPRSKISYHRICKPLTVFLLGFNSHKEMHAERVKHTRRDVLKNDTEPLAKPGQFPAGADIGAGAWKQTANPLPPKSFPMDFTVHNPRVHSNITGHQWDMKAKGVHNMLRSSDTFQVVIFNHLFGAEILLSQVARAGGGWNTKSSNAIF